MREPNRTVFDVAVILVASATLLQGVAGVVTAPESIPPTPAASTAFAGVYSGPLIHDPGGATASDTQLWRHLQQSRVHPSLVPQLAGQALLSQIALFDEQQLREFDEQNPEVVRQLLLDPPPAEQVGAWWASLPASVQHHLHDAAPEMVGNLPGVPFATRDSANRRLLTETISQLEGRLESGAGRGEGTDIRARLSMLHQVEFALQATLSGPPRSIVALDTQWPGRVAVVVGDLMRADYVSYLVPGMFFTVEGQAVDWTNTAVELYDEQTGWLTLLGKTDRALRGTTVATVAWLGYESPNLFTVASEDLANAGALYLDSAMDALYTERAESRPYVSVLAHSYGSTAAMKALATGNFSIDSFAVVGSPGSAAKSVDELHVTGRNVFVGEASWDPVVGTGYFGSNPGDPTYGAHRMSVDGGPDLITQAELGVSIGHNGYFEPGSESLRNMALIGIGRGSLVSDGSGDDVLRTLAYFDDLI